MSTAELPNVTAATAAEVCARVELSEAARPLLDANPTPAGFLDALMAGEHFADATGFLAQGLLQRTAVHWAYVCAHHAAGAAPPPAVAAALEATADWLRNPTEDNGRTAMAAAEAAGTDTPAGLAATAAFSSGSSLAPAGQHPVPPPLGVTGQAVAGAVILAALQIEPERAAEKFRRYLDQGLDIARGGDGRPGDGAR